MPGSLVLVGLSTLPPPPPLWGRAVLLLPVVLLVLSRRAVLERACAC